MLGTLSYSTFIVIWLYLVSFPRHSKILFENRDFFHTPCIQRPRLGIGSLRRNIAIRFLNETRMLWLVATRLWKSLRIYLYSFRHNMRTWQTDRRTDGRTRQKSRTLLTSAGQIFAYRSSRSSHYRGWLVGIASGHGVYSTRLSTKWLIVGNFSFVCYCPFPPNLAKLSLSNVPACLLRSVPFCQ